jgi:hypothetical protein
MELKQNNKQSKNGVSWGFKVLIVLILVTTCFFIQNCGIHEDLDHVRPIVYDFDNGQVPRNQDLSNEPTLVEFTLFGEYFGSSREMHRGEVTFINTDTNEEYQADVIAWGGTTIFGEVIIPPGKYKVKVRARDLESLTEIYYYKGTDYHVIDLD